MTLLDKLFQVCGVKIQNQFLRMASLVGNDKGNCSYLRQAFCKQNHVGNVNLSELNMTDLTCGFVYILSRRR